MEGAGGAEGEGRGWGEGVGREGRVSPAPRSPAGRGAPRRTPAPRPAAQEPRRRCWWTGPLGRVGGVGAVPGAGASGDGKSEWGAGPRYGKADAQRRAPLSVSLS